MPKPKQKKARGAAMSPKSARDEKGLKDLPAKGSADVRGGAVASLPIESALTSIYSGVEDDATSDLRRTKTPARR